MKNVIQVQNEYRKQQWAQIIRECQSSGLSNKEYCRQQGILEKTYYYWLRKLRSEAAEGIPQIVEVEPPGNADQGLYSISWSGTDIAGGDRRGSNSGGSAALVTTAMIDLSRVRKYYVACGYTDLRRGIDGLAAIVASSMAGSCGRTAYFCFAGGGRIGSRRCTIQETDMCCCTNG